MKSVLASASIVGTKIGIAKRGTFCGLDEYEPHRIVYRALDAFPTLRTQMRDAQVAPIDAVAVLSLFVLIF